MAFDPTLGFDDATAPVERELHADPAAAREVLRFLENGRALRATARELGVHPNTLNYRLRRFWARTDLDPDRVADLLRLALAARRVGSAGARPAHPAHVGGH